MISSTTKAVGIPEQAIDVVEPGRRARKGRSRLELIRDIQFSTAGLESYAFARWQSVVYDAMVVSAAIEYGDRILRRPAHGWMRQLSVRIPVHDPDRWKLPEVSQSLQNAVEFLTGDRWLFDFIRRSRKTPAPSQDYLDLPTETKAIIAYSDGMDSRAVAAILDASLGASLVRVRVGSTKCDISKNGYGRIPFAIVPYDVPANMGNKEASSRSRGFKFALISAIAAYLTDANEIVIPESGQGAIGPALIPVGHAYPDYRNHPLFAVRMQRFIRALLNKELRFVFPRIWNTKGETLLESQTVAKDADLCATRSCWRSNRWCSVNGKRRQCGVCAACMLRRVAVHTARLTEPDDTYVAVAMDATTLEKAVDSRFTRMTTAFREYAIAGFLHMEHLAEMAKDESLPDVRRHATLLALALGVPQQETQVRLTRLLSRHAQEWNNYMESLGSGSFLRQWAQGR